ncbi:MAG: histidine phosphatase family protein [Bacteroidia bacterium]|nr:histidine phosphatase family protein [Bacteroidia bacterium]NND52041.1 histidine phosphatase family protein [Flavobacteriaceae bacterium]
MKSLVLVRHAKSSWEYDVGDKERPLKKRGKNDAKIVSNEFLNTEFQPDMVFSSPANRAHSTCKIFQETLGIPDDKLEVTDELYDFGGSSVLNFLKNLDDNYQNVMIFGHNHAFTSVSNLLGSQYFDNLPTSGLVLIDFNIDSWADLNKGKTRLALIPSQLR